jgi:hypothetical protein
VPLISSAFIQVRIAACYLACYQTPPKAAELRLTIRRYASKDFEGVVAKHRAGRYGEDEPTRRLKIKNPESAKLGIGRSVAFA